MKIVQSYWSLPSAKRSNSENDRFLGGWYSERYHIYSWIFSFLQLNKHYNNIELVTDKKGKSMLYDFCEIPYDKISLDLENININNEGLWAIGKIISYSIQKEHFIHVDNDIFVWDKFPIFIENAEFACQNIEANFFYYAPAIKIISENTKVPLNFQSNDDNIFACNAGLFGGKNYKVINEFCENLLNFIYDNKSFFNSFKDKDFNLNLVIEQYYSYNFISKKNIAITPLLEDTDINIFGRLMRFNLLPQYANYIHLLGASKRNLLACEQLEARFRFHYPIEYKHIFNKLQKSKDISLLTEERYIYLESLYLKFSKIENYYKYKYVLNSKVKLYENYCMYFSVLENKNIFILFEGWDALINYFAKPMYLNDILNILSIDNMNKADLEKLKFNLINFVSDKLIYSEILVIA